MKTTKVCSNCFQEKYHFEFYPKLKGLQSRCKTCNAEVVKGYRERKIQKDREKRIAKVS